MDPLTAFGLAAGVLQVVGFSLDAVKTCHELYKDGSLAQNREVRNVMDELGKNDDFQFIRYMLQCSRRSLLAFLR